jgi:hypothetical protein
MRLGKGEGVRRRMVTVAAGVAALSGLLAGCSAASATGAAPAAGSTSAGTATGIAGQLAGVPRSPAPKPTPAAQLAPQSRPVDPGAGTKPQTMALPSTHSQAFKNAMYDVWLAVTTGKAAYGRPAFFPEPAYEKLKAIAYPGSDWTYRLLYDYDLDIAAAHDLVGTKAQLVEVLMAPSYEAAWIPPGYCYNSVGYWHINGARLVYRSHGETRSIGIASLISWRGVWYVVHFGAVIRPAIGIVDDPEAGTGYPGPAGGC